jgi:hypothetical protein
MIRIRIHVHPQHIEQLIEWSTRVRPLELVQNCLLLCDFGQLMTWLVLLVEPANLTSMMYTRIITVAKKIKTNRF